MTKTRVLFMCMANTARSQMAEAFLRHYGGERFEAYSAGFEPAEIDPLTIEVMAERGLDLSDQRSKAIAEYLGRVHFGYVIILCDRAQRACPTTFPGMGTRLFWPFEDPVAFAGTQEQRREKFREVRDALEARIQGWLRSL